MASKLLVRPNRPVFPQQTTSWGAPPVVLILMGRSAAIFRCVGLRSCGQRPGGTVVLCAPRGLGSRMWWLEPFLRCLQWSGLRDLGRHHLALVDGFGILVHMSDVARHITVPCRERCVAEVAGAIRFVLPMAGGSGSGVPCCGHLFPITGVLCFDRFVVVGGGRGATTRIVGLRNRSAGIGLPLVL